MKRGAFRLQPVLEARRAQERAAALAAAEAARAAADADRRATEAEDAVAAVLPTGAVGSGAFRAAMVLARVAAEDAAAARSLATASAEQAGLVRAAWTAAAQRTKGLERLRERHLQTVRLAEQAAEERTVDDLVTGRSARRTSSGEVPWTD
ncbi:flagellar export protein FliJ [Geodermatophilus sp. SYSU D00742]